MTKTEFVEKYAEKTGMSKKDAANAVNAFFEVTADALRTGDKVVFTGRSRLHNIPAECV